jgi:hypothetical protein
MVKIQICILATGLVVASESKFIHNLFESPLTNTLTLMNLRPTLEKKLLNNICHNQDFVAEWLFSEASDGRNACDKVGGTLKWLPAVRSDHIMPK